MTPDPGDVVLVLRPVADPMTKRGLPGRDPTYRLKVALKALLRAFGWKCVSVTNARGIPTVEIPVRQGESDASGDGARS